MRWLPLDLENFSAISQEVDDAVIMYKDLAGERADNPSNAGAAEAFAQMQASVEQRVTDLENFYYEHDLDERAILFEKQRLKLRKLLNMELPKPRTEAITAGDDYLEDEPAYVSSEQPNRRRPASASASMRRQQAQRKTRKGQPQLVHSSNKNATTRVAPIYDWEVRGNSQAVDEEQPDVKCFEFQVRLAPHEYEELMERRSMAGTRGRSFLRKGDGQTMATVRKAPVQDAEEAPYVTSSGPYIEPQYFENWRYVAKDKWVAKNDFAITKEKKNFADKLQLDDFLHNGPYIENAFKACLRGEDGDKWVADDFRRHV